MAKTNDYNIGFVIEGDPSGAVRAVKLTETQLDKLNNAQKKVTRSATDYAAAAGRLVNTLGRYAAIGGGLALAATTAMVTKQLAVADATAKTADKLGLTTEALGGLRHAAELTGVAQSKLDIALQRMTRRLVDVAQTGGGPAAAALDQLGLKASELMKLRPEQQMAVIADKMKGIETQSQRVAIAFKLFDSEGVALVNTLALGSEGLAEAAKEAQLLGIAMTRIDAAKIEAANDAITRATGVVTGLGNEITVQVAPIIEGLATEFLNAAKEAGGVGEVVTTAMKYATRAVGVFADGLHGIHILFKGGETAALGWAKLVTQIMGRTARVIVDAINGLPEPIKQFFGLTNIEFEQTLIGRMARAVDEEFKDSLDELNRLLAKPLPSRAIEEWTANVQSKAQAAAEQVAANSLKVIDDTASLVLATQEKTTDGIDKMLGRSLANFRSFGQQLQSMAAEILNNLALQFARNSLNVSLGLSGGVSGAAGVAGVVNSTLQGLSGTNAMAALSSSLLGGGGGASGGFSASISNLFAPKAATPAAGALVIDPATGIPIKAAGSGSTPFFQSNLGGALASIGASFAGGFVGTKTGEAITGKEANSSIGATGGAFVGQILGGPIGAFIGSTIGGFVDALFGSKNGPPEFNLGATNKSAMQQFDGANIEKVIESAFGNLRLRTEADFAKGMSESDRANLFGLFDAIAGLEEGISAQLTDQQRAAAAAAAQAQPGLSGTGNPDFAPYLVERFNRIFDAIGGEVDAAFDRLAAGLNPKNMLAQIDQLAQGAFEFVALTDALNVDVIAETTKALQEQQTEQTELVRVYDQATEQLRTAAAEFDKTRDSILSVTQALQVQQDAAAQLVVAYHNVADAARLTIEGAIDSIDESLLSAEELYNQRRDTITSLVESLANTTDPGQIAAMVTQITQLTQAAFGSLDDSQKSALGGGFKELLQQANTTAQAQIAQGLADLAAQQTGTQQVVQVELLGAAAIQNAAASMQTSVANMALQFARGEISSLQFNSGVQDLARAAGTFQTAGGTIDLAVAGLGGSIAILTQQLNAGQITQAQFNASVLAIGNASQNYMAAANAWQTMLNGEQVNRFQFVANMVAAGSSLTAAAADLRDTNTQTNIVLAGNVTNIAAQFAAGAISQSSFLQQLANQGFTLQQAGVLVNSMLRQGAGQISNASVDVGGTITQLGQTAISLAEQFDAGVIDQTQFIAGLTGIGLDLQTASGLVQQHLSNATNQVALAAGNLNTAADTTNSAADKFNTGVTTWTTVNPWTGPIEQFNQAVNNFANARPGLNIQLTGLGGDIGLPFRTGINFGEPTPTNAPEDLVFIEVNV